MGRGPKERRDTPAEAEVLRRGTWDLVLVEARRSVVVIGSGRWRALVGVASSVSGGGRRPATLEAREEAVLPIVRLRERMVTVEGIAPEAAVVVPRGEARGGVEIGAGSLERAECTRASRRAIWAVRERIWVRELDGGILWLVDLMVLGAGIRGAGVRNAALPVVAARAPGVRPAVDVVNCLGLGVML